MQQDDKMKKRNSRMFGLLVDIAIDCTAIRMHPPFSSLRHTPVLESVPADTMAVPGRHPDQS